MENEDDFSDSKTRSSRSSMSNVVDLSYNPLLSEENLDKINELASKNNEIEHRLKQTLGVLGIPYNDQSCSENLTSLDANSALK